MWGVRGNACVVLAGLDCDEVKNGLARNAISNLVHGFGVSGCSHAGRWLVGETSGRNPHRFAMWESRSR